MDLAEIIERISRLKRAMCSADLGLSDDQVFALDLLDPNVIAGTARYVRMKSGDHSSEPPAYLSEILAELEEIRVALAGPPYRPSDAALCERYARGEINVRTLVTITGWDIDQIVDRCAGVGVTIS